MVRKIIGLVRSDTLYVNSLYLLSNTLVMAAAGFLFWLISTHLYLPAQIGIATSLISAMALVSYISLLGFNSTFVRFLPTSKTRSQQISTGLVLSITVAVIVATGYVLLVPVFAPKLGLIHDNFWYGLGFVIMAALAAVNLLTDSIFIAFRAAKYNLLIDGFIMSSIRVVLPIFLVGLGAYGIFAASGAAASVAMVCSLYFLIKYFSYKPTLKIDKPVLRDVLHYSFSSYIANLLNIAPTLILPLIVINRLGPSAAAYYYLAFMIANLLYTVAYSVAQSLFAEGSYADRAFGSLVKKAVAILAVVTVAGSLALILIAPVILLIFGHDYSRNATGVLRIFALAAPGVALYVLSSTLLRITKHVYALIVVDIVYFVTICGLSMAWAHKGLNWIGLAWLVGQLIAGALGLAVLAKHRFGLRKPAS